MIFETSELSEVDKKIIRMLADMPITERPYLEIAKELGTTEDEIISRAKYFIEKGIFRRFALSINHRNAGILGNTLCTVNVPEKNISEIGRKISEDAGVTHCYSRSGLPQNLYFMVHGKDAKESESKALKILSGLGLKDYSLRTSIKEYKKTSFVI